MKLLQGLLILSGLVLVVAAGLAIGTWLLTLGPVFFLALILVILLLK